MAVPEFVRITRGLAIRSACSAKWLAPRWAYRNTISKLAQPPSSWRMFLVRVQQFLTNHPPV
jgi:hypothetical protein